MAKIFVHVRDNASEMWKNEPMVFQRIPSVGEHVVLSATSAWYRVETVVHCPYEGAEFDAELYAIKVDHLQVIAHAAVPNHCK